MSRNNLNKKDAEELVRGAGFIPESERLKEANGTRQPPSPIVRSKAEADANYEQVLKNLAASRASMAGINPAGQMPSRVTPPEDNIARRLYLDSLERQKPQEVGQFDMTAETKEPQVMAKKAALQRMVTPPTQDFGRVELDESLPDLDSQVREARTRAMSPVSKNAQPALPAPVGADEDEEIKRAEQLARTQNR